MLHTFSRTLAETISCDDSRQPDQLVWL